MHKFPSPTPGAGGSPEHSSFSGQMPGLRPTLGFPRWHSPGAGLTLAGMKTARPAAGRHVFPLSPLGQCGPGYARWQCQQRIARHVSTPANRREQIGDADRGSPASICTSSPVTLTWSTGCTILESRPRWKWASPVTAWVAEAPNPSEAERRAAKVPPPPLRNFYCGTRREERFASKSGGQ